MAVVNSLWQSNHSWSAWGLGVREQVRLQGGFQQDFLLFPLLVFSPGLLLPNSSFGLLLLLLSYFFHIFIFMFSPPY